MIVKECPFCGSTAKVSETFGRGFYIQCQNKNAQCNAYISSCITKEEAVKQWNRRTDEKK